MVSHEHQHQLCTIIPTHIIKQLVRTEPDQKKQSKLIETLHRSVATRATRKIHYDDKGLSNTIVQADNASKGRFQKNDERLNIFDCRGSYNFPKKPVLQLGAKQHGTKPKIMSQKQLDYLDVVYKFYHDVLHRDSFNSHGAVINFYGDYGDAYDNAFWDGKQLVFGTGDEEIFLNFADFIDVIAHEFTHGVTQYEANLSYQGQSGALNEAISDIIGETIKQYEAKQSANDADWLVGAGLINKENFPDAIALRSMKEPGTAYNNNRLGKDPQPDHMNKYVNTDEDNGGVHINSGIPNKAYYNFATSLGGNSWDIAVKVFYKALQDQRLTNPNTDFRGFADATFRVAGRGIEGSGVDAASLQQKVKDAWVNVGVSLSQ